MIPRDEEMRIRKALGYMTERKVLQWAQVTISEKITQRDIIRVAREMPKNPGIVRVGSTREANRPPIGTGETLRDTGTLGKKIDDYIKARSKECGVHPDCYKRALGWR